MAKAPLCPVCRKHPAEPDYRPFCSRRCADVDLQGWLSGRYAIPAADDESAVRDTPSED
ncbi:DNA gyrase inhibitor YacG [Brevundimonas sp.]|uniref:DNA gyrase inhibitor YacG n=1 Tax=Brevundimonas sp. TaxID=1871086 RepID=UPI0025F923DF|nr:DNA gyrase inhibitor YacG [Brevundimonas sp.]